jgi:PAS domain S-box-containing protein
MTTRDAAGQGRPPENGVPDETRDHAQARAFAAEQRFQLVVDSVRDYAIFMLDPLGRIATWNEGAKLIKGYLPEEVIGKDLSIFYTPEDLARKKPRALLDAALAEGRVEDEGWRVRKDGSRFWADVVITPIRDARGQLQGFVKVTRDLTSRKDAEEKLRQSEESLAATLYSIGDGVLATDEQARVTRINPVAERLTGWHENEAMGHPITEVFNIINEETRATAANPVTRVLAEGVVVGLANHTALISRDGTERPIADSGAPILDAQGKPRGAVLVFRDVTAERSAEEALRRSEEKLRQMVGSVRDYALYMLDPKGNVASWNPGAERIKGYREDEIIGKHFSRFFTPEDIAQGKPDRELEIAASQGRFEEENWRLRKDGSRFWANVVLTPMRDSSNRLAGFVKITRDLTDRRKMEEERLRLVQAQEAIRLRDEFLSIASHELKTPLTALQLQLLGILDQVAAGDDGMTKRVDRAMRMGDRLAQLIEALLSVSRIATGRLALNLEAFNLVDAAREASERLRESATAAGSELSFAAAYGIDGQWDRLRVEQVLTNLISNSIKYAAGTPIKVSVSRDADAAILNVQDEGPGIPEADLSRIFRRFERASSTRHYGGMGLGLYVAQQIAEAHGGTIVANNVPGGGACFTVRLPLDPPLEPAPNREPAAT